MACTAMIPPWTALDQTVNQMRLRCASGSREAQSRNTPSCCVQVKTRFEWEPTKNRA